MSTNNAQTMQSMQHLSVANKKKRPVLNRDEVRRFIEQSGLYNFNGSDVLAWGYNAQENVLLFGPGGYGKSDGAILFTDYLREVGALEKDEKPFVMSLGQHTTEEQLYGGLDLKKFNDSGELEYLIKKSFTQHRIVIFEEMFDAYASVLLILKDILQSRYVRIGNQYEPIVTEMVIACTNRTYEEVVVDNSTEALLQRFVFQENICWSSHAAVDYSNAIVAAYKLSRERKNPMIEAVALVCEKVTKDPIEYVVSPRTAIKMFHSATVNGIESLKGFRFCQQHAAIVIEQMGPLIEDTEEANRMKDIASNTAKEHLLLIQEYVEAKDGKRLPIYKKDIPVYIDVCKNILSDLITISKIKVRDKNVDLRKQLKASIGEALNTIYNMLKLNIKAKYSVIEENTIAYKVVNGLNFGEVCDYLDNSSEENLFTKI